MDIAGVEIIVQRLMVLAVEILLPLLSLGFIAALVIGVLQAMMQIQEQTLSFTPKLLVIIGVFIFLGPSMFDSLAQYVREIIMSIPDLL